MSTVSDRLKRWLWPEPKPRAKGWSARAHLDRIEYKLDRQAYHLTRAILHLPTSGLMEQSPPSRSDTLTATSAATPTRASAPVTESTAPPPLINRHVKKHAPKVLGWLAERIGLYLWSLSSGVVLSAIGAVYKWWQEIWAAVWGWWTWLFPFAG